jgi:hypothetical protein
LAHEGLGSVRVLHSWHLFHAGGVSVREREREREREGEERGREGERERGQHLVHAHADSPTRIGKGGRWRE